MTPASPTFNQVTNLDRRPAWTGMLCVCVLSAGILTAFYSGDRSEPSPPGPSGRAGASPSPKASGTPASKPAAASGVPRSGPGPQTTSGRPPAPNSVAPSVTGKPPCAQQLGGPGGSTKDSRAFRSRGTASLQQGEKRTAFQFPTEFSESFLAEGYTISGDAADGKNFNFRFEVLSDGRLTSFSVTRPTDKGFVSLNFPLQRALPWLSGQQKLRTDTCGGGNYRVTLTRPEPGTWVFDIRRLTDVTSEFDISRGRFTVSSRVQALPDQWRSVALRVDFLSADYRFLFDGRLDAQ